MCIRWLQLEPAFANPGYWGDNHRILTVVQDKKENYYVPSTTEHEEGGKSMLALHDRLATESGESDLHRMHTWVALPSSRQ